LQLKLNLILSPLTWNPCIVFRNSVIIEFVHIKKISQRTCVWEASGTTSMNVRPPPPPYNPNATSVRHRTRAHCCCVSRTYCAPAGSSSVQQTCGPADSLERRRSQPLLRQHLPTALLRHHLHTIRMPIFHPRYAPQLHAVSILSVTSLPDTASGLAHEMEF
jgi:hypothetical protein